MAYSVDELAERERRRWMQPNAHLWMRPDAQRFMRLDAARSMPNADRWRHPDEKLWNFHAAHQRRAKSALEMGERQPFAAELAWRQAEQDAIRARFIAWKSELARTRARERADAERLKRRYDAAWDKFIAAFNRHWDACRKAGFNPAQPRVPAGNPDGGQWTDSGGSGGGGRNDPRVLSDATPDNDWKPGARYAQNDHLDDRIDLSENTHVMQQHVRSSDYVLRRVREIAQRAEELGDDFEGLRAGSFSSLEAANKLVNSTLAQNQTVVDQVADGAREGARIEARFGAPTGYEAYIARPYSQAELRDTYGVRVVIQHDPVARRGFRVITAFPVR